ncbi:MAG: choice-of-anchor tandem repeat GloVer-containing protein, partial [Terriglobales bacterium]
TYSGGAYGYGTVFKITPRGTETVLHSFNPANGTDGSNPYVGLVMDATGNLYGTTYSGGANGAGTVFKVTP